MNRKQTKHQIFSTQSRSIVIVTLCLFSSIAICGMSSQTAMAVSPLPTARHGHKLIFDSLQNQLILFGGASFTDLFTDLHSTWIYSISNQAWHTSSSSLSPGERLNHGMVYVPDIQKVILFGGMTSPNYNRVNDMWSFDSNTSTWVELFPEILPPQMSNPSLYYDSDAHKIILFGGMFNNETYSDDTWVYDLVANNWECILTNTPPTSRYGHTMVYDSSAHLGILFGGRVRGLSSEAWSFNFTGRQWNKIVPNSTPLPRYWFDMAFDSTLNQTILFGGDNEQSPIRALGDTWALDATASTWTDLSPSTSPCPRTGHAVTYTTSSREIFLFGGCGEDYSEDYGDLWAFNSEAGDWRLIHSESKLFSPLWTVLLIVIPIIGIGALSLILIKKKQPKFLRLKKNSKV